MFWFSSSCFSCDSCVLFCALAIGTHRRESVTSGESFKNLIGFKKENVLRPQSFGHVGGPRRNVARRELIAASMNIAP